ncbi:MAG: hypothetical protein ACI4P1_05640, partial [Erysipelotrichaceae bacterium]
MHFDEKITTWMDQAEKYVANGYTLTEGIWDAGKNAEMVKMVVHYASLDQLGISTSVWVLLMKKLWVTGLSLKVLQLTSGVVHGY